MNRQIYQPELALLTDLYQLTMAAGYFRLGRAERGAVFHLFFRRTPFQGGYAIAAGMESVCEFLQAYQFQTSDIDYLATLTGNNAERLFADEFLSYLSELKFTCDVDAIPEGNLVFGHEPILRIRGPLLQCQLLETALLNIINFQTLIATKASRICRSAGDDPVLEFGLRRAQGVDGGVSASRAAFIGGCAATSNVLAGKLYGIPVKGTHAHSWVMSFDSELESFQSYAEALPNNCVFLVDTYDTLSGVRHAIEVGRKLKEQGHQLAGIRLDSGDLAYLSIEARKLLDDAGFRDAAIVASNDLDESVIASLKSQGAQISIWGVGTKLATAFDQPALGGVYKLGAIQNAEEQWQPCIKRSEQLIKTSIPGELQVRRYRTGDRLIGDVIYDLNDAADPREATLFAERPMKLKLDQHAEATDLLAPMFREGRRVWDAESLVGIQQRCREQLTLLNPRTTRLLNHQPYPVGLSSVLFERRQTMMDASTD